MALLANMRARPGLTLSVAVALVILIALGSWQLTRLAWKTALIRNLAAAEALAPLPLNDALALGPKAAWRRAGGIACHLSPEGVIYLHAIKDATPGYHLIDVCPQKSGPALITDLGFSATKPLSFSDIDVSLSGRLRPLEAANGFTPPNDLKGDDWYARTPLDIEQRFGVAVRSDYFLVVDLERSQLSVPGLSQGAITAELPNRHLEYALTWYGLAAVLVAFYVVMIKRPKTLQA